MNPENKIYKKLLSDWTYNFLSYRINVAFPANLCVQPGE